MIVAGQRCRVKPLSTTLARPPFVNDHRAVPSHLAASAVRLGELLNLRWAESAAGSRVTVAGSAWGRLRYLRPSEGRGQMTPDRRGLGCDREHLLRDLLGQLRAHLAHAKPVSSPATARRPEPIEAAHES